MAKRKHKVETQARRPWKQMAQEQEKRATDFAALYDEANRKTFETRNRLYAVENDLENTKVKLNIHRNESEKNAYELQRANDKVAGLELALVLMQKFCNALQRMNALYKAKGDLVSSEDPAPLAGAKDFRFNEESRRWERA